MLLKAFGDIIIILRLQPSYDITKKKLHQYLILLCTYTQGRIQDPEKGGAECCARKARADFLKSCSLIFIIIHYISVS